MTLQWIKQSRSATFDRGKWSGTQNYLVRDDADASINVYTIASNASSYEPFGAGDDTTMATYMRFVSATYTPVSDGMDKIWSAVFTYESTMGDGVNVVTADVKTETEVGYSSIESQIREESVEIWRTGTTVPSGGTQNNNDIGGTKADSAGEPISFLLPIASISIRNVIYGRPAYATIMAVAGKRNDASFTFGATGNTFTCAAGTLVFTGASTSRISTAAEKLAKMKADRDAAKAERDRAGREIIRRLMGAAPSDLPKLRDEARAWIRNRGREGYHGKHDGNRVD
jgi:hypothetical protein